MEIHMHISRIPIEEVPVNEEKLQLWLFERYKKKDKLEIFHLNNYYFFSLIFYLLLLGCSAIFIQEVPLLEAS